MYLPYSSGVLALGAKSNRSRFSAKCFACSVVCGLAITAAAARLAVRSFRVPFKIYSSFKVNIINYHHTTTA